MTGNTPAREVFERLQRHLTGDPSGAAMGEELWAEDLVVETPFAPPGRPRRWEGRGEFLAFAQKGRAALTVRLEQRNVVIHETADPDVIVVEYELGGTIPGTGREAWAPFIGVLRVRDGRVAHWREYQDPLAVAEAMGQMPALLEALTAR